MKIMLRQERIQRGWTQEYVAEKCGVSPQSVCDWDIYRRKPSFDVLVKLVELFGYDDFRLLFAPVDEDNSES